MRTGLLAFLFFDVVLDALYSPIWWYTEGAVCVFRFFTRNVRYGANMIGIGVWARSLFKPMYGERTWQGRVVSFVMRTIILLWDVFVFALLLVFLSLFVAAWMLFPPLVVWQITRLLL
ncbi:hypothetical protein HY623_03085 [Candidatus Uhrbacteria bacterium]|nr:hypothetical protein [Candidatus Uhrbacteria bacterium]